MRPALLLLPILLSFSAFAADTIYGDIPGVPGDALDPDFEGAINVLSVSAAYAASPTARTVVSGPIVITKQVDIATPMLMSLGSSLAPIKSITLSMVTGDQVYMELTLQDAVITEWSMVENTDFAPGLEQISFQAASVSMDVITYDAAGRANKPITGSFKAQ